jgi:hypothetical protein
MESPRAHSKAWLSFSIQIDCESTQLALKDPSLGERAIRGLQEILGETQTLGTFLVIPGDLEAHAGIYRELEEEGHEIGLHYHASHPRQSEFLGTESPENQLAFLADGIARFEDAMGRPPKSFCPGYFSANDHTFPILEELGFTHGAVSLPTRNLPHCACVWGGSSLNPRYPHRFHRSLDGDVNFVDLPPTIDPESRMWGGGHPMDLRVELVDAKNHWYTIKKAVDRQLAEKAPVLQIHALTHNVFEYGEVSNFRRQTYEGIVKAVRQIAESHDLEFAPTTLKHVAEAYRQKCPFSATTPVAPILDIRGRAYAA